MLDFLDQARLRPLKLPNYRDLIINTLLKAKNSGKSQNTIINISYCLKQLNKNADLGNPEQVKTYIANTKICNATKTKLVFAYNWFCNVNGIQWTKPRYRWERKLPLIPTTENINKIINASNKKYKTTFTILAALGRLLLQKRKERDEMSYNNCRRCSEDCDFNKEGLLIEREQDIIHKDRKLEESK